MRGQLKRSIEVSGNESGRVQVDCQGLASGVYLYSPVVDGKAVATNRLVLILNALEVVRTAARGSGHWRSARRGITCFLPPLLSGTSLNPIAWQATGNEFLL